MLKPVYIIFLFALLFHVKATYSQENTTLVQGSILIDTSLVGADAMLDTFISNHVPLSKDELHTLELKRSFSIYGDFINDVITKGYWYKIGLKSEKQLNTKRVHQNKEWLFYTFAGLFFFIGLINSLYSNYLAKLIRGYVNEGFIFFQAREQLSQYPMASFLMNLFFFFATTVFIFFWLTVKGVNFPVQRWEALIVILLALVLVYIFKLIFLNAMGFVFNQREVFSNYVFIVFLNNKITGILLLFFSFILAFTEASQASTIANIALVILVLAFIYRFFKGFSLFSKQGKLSLFSFSLAVFSLEILPTAVLLKFISNRMMNILTENLN